MNTMKKEMNLREESLKKLKEVNAIEGLYPETLTITGYNNDGSTYSYLPVSLQRKWFFLRYPNGKIAPENPVKLTDDCLLITVYVYANKEDNKEHFIGKGQKLFTMNDLREQFSGDAPFERIVTMTVGRALSDAGFDAVCDEVLELEKKDSFSYNEQVEKVFPSTPTPTTSAPATLDKTKAKEPTPIVLKTEAEEKKEDKKEEEKKTETTTETIQDLSEMFQKLSEENVDTSETKTDKAKNTESLTLSLEDSFKVISTFKNSKGLTLKEIYETNKALIGYFVTCSGLPENEVEAAKVICRSDAELMAKLKRKGTDI